MITRKNNRLSHREILGYTIGSIGDSSSYNFVLNFFSFFMTTVAGVSPIVAGTIISLAIIWDAITDPVVGFIIDRSKSKHGKRRPFILGSLIPMGAAIILMFLKVNLSQDLKNIYYFIILLVFWTSYTIFNIPFYSFGAVISPHDDDRIKISAFREVMGYIGIFCASALPTYLVGKFVEKGLAQDTSWFLVAILVTTITLSTILLMWKCTKGKEPIEIIESNIKTNPKEFFKELWHLTKLKPYILVILCALFSNIYMTLFNSNLIYYAIYNMEITEVQASILFTVMNVTSIVLIPFITKATEIFTKEKVFIFSMTFSGFIMIIAKFINITSILAGSIYVVLAGIGTCAYWLCIFNFVYDTIDYAEFKTGIRRDGIMMSYYSFLLKLGGSIAAWLQGLFLQFGGFNAEVSIQSETTIKTIESLFIIYPGIVMILAGTVMIFTPLTHKTMENIRITLQNKNN